MLSSPDALVTPAGEPSRLSSPAETLLGVRGITKRFGGVVALDGVDLTLARGRVLGLLGANGSGKSTLSRIIAGEVVPDGGTMEMAGAPLSHASPQAAARRGIIIAHQHPSLAPDMPVWENIFLGAEICAPGGFINRGEARRRATGILAELGSTMDIGQPAGVLTAAGQQLVEIARALARSPRLLILDEPTAALAGAEVAKLFAAIRRLTAKGIGVIFISHRLGEIGAICDDILVMRNGRTAGAWTTSGRLDEARILSLMTGDPDAVLRPMAARALGDTILKLQGLRAGSAVRGVDLELRRGEIVGLAGLQGQGQAELLEVIAGHRRIDGGTLWHRDRAVTPSLPRDMIRRGVCLVPDDRLRQGLFSGESVGENLGYVKIALAKRPWTLPLAELGQLAAATIRRLLIKTEGPEQLVSALSGGNQQKVVIGKWLATDIEVLLLSDPTKGVDIHARSEIYAIIGELAAAGTTALIFASEIQELLLHCDRILVMYEGRIVGNLSGAAMTEPRIMAAAFGRASEGADA
ncbi:MAG: sugar ABC transporter ATP-binding protein [Proteobacteria bacterium]|nr:sugar ABC transporter ATP-binding protein [Pseudomonadota bacterium]